MKNKRFKLRYKRLIIFLIVVLLFVFLLIFLLNLRITNIYVSGNNYISDQSIIEFAKIQNYPKTFFNFSSDISSRLNSSIYIEKSTVKKRGLTKVYIDVVENRPYFYSELKKKTILKNGEYSSDIFNVPILLNDVDSSIYNQFLEKYSLINLDVVDIISEIKYVPNDVDNKLFMFSMNDGNFVYVNLDRFEIFNKYFDYVAKFNNHRGILFLDSGEYFKILDN